MATGNGDHLTAQPNGDLESGNATNTTNRDQFLIQLAVEGDQQLFEEEMKVRAELNRTPLHLAALDGKVEVVRCIVKRLKFPKPLPKPSPNPGNVSYILGIEYAQDVVNAKDCYGYTPLHLAIRELPKSEVAQSEEALWWHAWWQKLKTTAVYTFLIRWLPTRRAQGENAAALQEAQEAQEAAVREQREEVVRILTTSSLVLPDRFIAATSLKGDEYEEECEGFTPLHVAAVKGNISIVKLLLRQPLCRGEYNACDPVNICATTWKGHSPLDLAKQRGHVKLVDLLECSDLNWLQSERAKNANSVNAVLVGATLVAATTFATWLQPPLGIPDPVTAPIPEKLLKQSRRSAAFFIAVEVAFALSVTALIIGTYAVIPFHGAPLKSEVQYLRTVVKRAASLMFVAISSLGVAFLYAATLVFDEVAFAHDDNIYNAEKRIVFILYFGSVLYLLYFSLVFDRRQNGKFGKKTRLNVLKNIFIFCVVPVGVYLLISKLKK